MPSAGLANGQDPLSVAGELIQLASQLVTERDLERLLAGLLSAAMRMTGADAGRVFVLDRAMRSMNCRVSARHDGRPTLKLDPIAIYAEDERYKLGDAHVFAIVTGRVVMLDDIYRYTGYDFSSLYRADEASGYRTTSFLAAPMASVKGTTLGVLELVNLQLDEHGAPASGRLEQIVRTVAVFAGVAVDIAGLFSENQSLIRQLDRRADELERENARLKSETVATEGVPGIVAESSGMRQALGLLARATSSPKVTVLLLGETGTGKDLFAKAVHARSSRRQRPFVVQNCAALPESLLESELFGYRKGAFTGAVTDKKGLFQEAEGGTLFLDEIGDMPLGLQAKVLCVLEDGVVRRLGDTRGQQVDVRVIAATHVDLRRRIAQGQFREDLFYRLSVFPIHLPPLRDRAADLPRLIEHFVVVACQAHGRPPARLTARAFDALTTWHFPGNVRELRNAIERAVLLVDPDEPIDLHHLPAEIAASRPQPQSFLPGPMQDRGLRDIVQDFEARVIEAKLAEAGWNQSRAAESLAISRRSLVEKIGRYKLRPPASDRRDRAEPHRERAGRQPDGNLSP